MTITEVEGRCFVHRINERTGECSCHFTHPRLLNGEWDVSSDVKWGPLTEIPPIYESASADIYVNWPFC